MYQEKRLIGKKYFMYFENTKILRLNVFKNKIHLIFFKGTEIQNSILFLKLYSKNMITYMCVCVCLNVVVFLFLIHVLLLFHF